MIKNLQAKTFIEVGCGDGKFSKVLLNKGLTGYGVDFSKDALRKAAQSNQKSINEGKYQLVNANIMGAELPENVDMVCSFMTMEHVENDMEFLMKMKKITKPNGAIVMAVPARMDKWGVEDESAGHYRRYDREALKNAFEKVGLSNIKIWSVAVPTSNILLGLSNKVIKTATAQGGTKMSQEEKTKESGIMDIPYKTLFPSYYKLILNRITMMPLCLLQKLFYNSDRGVVLLISATNI